MVLDPFLEASGSWLLTYLLHSTLLLTAVALATRWPLASRGPAVHEALWRVGLLGGIVTSTLQVAFGLHPLAPPTFLGASGVEAAVLAEIVPAPPAAPLSGSASGAYGSALEAAAPPLAAGWTVPRVALAVFVGVAILALASLAYGWLRLRARLAERRPVRCGELSRRLQHLRAALGMRARVRLSASARISVPVAIGLLRPEICVPAARIDSLDEAQADALLAHELAHLRARDPLWRLLAHAVERALWIQPLNLVARRRLQDLAEYRCDDCAVRCTGDAVALASCLVEVASWPRPLSEHRVLQVVPAAAMPSSRLEYRVERVLRDAPSADAGPAPRWLAALLCVAGLGLPSLSLAAPPRPSPVAPVAPADRAPPVEPSVGRLALQLASLADVQGQVAQELAALRHDLAGVGAAPEWAAVLSLLQRRTKELQQECELLQLELAGAATEPSAPTDSTKE
ncbi:MAG: M56 family metallopeptidase [Planctomycetota bacterium]